MSACTCQTSEIDRLSPGVIIPDEYDMTDEELKSISDRAARAIQDAVIVGTPSQVSFLTKDVPQLVSEVEILRRIVRDQQQESNLYALEFRECQKVAVSLMRCQAEIFRSASDYAVPGWRDRCLTEAGRWERVAAEVEGMVP
jgi:hypothetical protein